VLVFECGIGAERQQLRHDALQPAAACVMQRRALKDVLHVEGIGVLCRFNQQSCRCLFGVLARLHQGCGNVFGGNVGTDRQQRSNSLGSSLPGSHVQARGEWILKEVLIERRQLPDELRQTVVFEVNDLADGLLVVGILVDPADLFRRRQDGRQGVKVPRYLGLKLFELLELRYICIYIHTYIHTCMHTYMHAYMHTKITVCVCVCVCVCVHI